MLLTSGLVSAQGEEPADIGKLVEDLASDSYQTRQQATEVLWEAGEEALVQLRKARVAADPEMSLRAAELLEKIELRITPDTPASILGLIRRYQEAPVNQKVNFLNELKRNKAYFQVLKLYSMEDRPEVRAVLAPVIEGVAISGARDVIASGNQEAAIDLLKMTANEPMSMMALACLYRSMGRLDEELKNPSPPSGVATDLWKITMLRAKGDMESAVALAASSDNPELLAGLKILVGDPTQWIRQNGLVDRGKQAHPVYVDIALKRWSGRKIADADFAPLLALLEDGDSDEKELVISALATLGRLSEVEKHLAEENPDLAFEYYLSRENITKALETFGLDPEKPDWTGWVAERFEELVAENDEEGKSSEAMSRLATVAGFLETRGLNKELADAFDTLLKRYAKENENHFLDFLGTLFVPGNSPHYAMTVAEDWAGDDENRWSEVFIVALGEKDVVSEWIQWVREIKPGISFPETLEVMIALIRSGDDPKHLRDTWMDLAWDAVDAAEPNLKPSLIDRIRILAVSQQDVANSLKAWDKLKASKLSMWNSIDRYLSAAGRWTDALATVEESGKIESSSSPELHAYLAVTLRRAGFEERAVEQDMWAEKLSLGYPPSCKRIGDYYTYGGDPTRAAMWYERAAFQADPASGEFLLALGSYAESAFEQGKWQIAASCYEAYAQVYASRNLVGEHLSFYSRARLNADLAKALAILPENKPRAVALLEGIHQNFTTDGILADNFFPLVRKAGLTQELDRWFGESWEYISEIIRRYPGSDNSKNTAAWFASRAGYKLKEAKAHLEAALDRNPNQPAYLDTMAEIYFASGDQKSAIKWSDRALMYYPLTEPSPPFDLMIRKQNLRFHSRRAP